MLSLLALAWTVYASSSRTSASYEDQDYGITIDAGSSHTGFFVFRWKKRITDSPYKRIFSKPESPSHWHKKIKPGIGHFAMESHGNDMEDYLDPLFEFGRTLLRNVSTSVDFSQVPVFFGATAGLRIITYTERHALMNRVRRYIGNSGFKFSDDQAHVLSGEEESMFNWITINFYEGFFDDTKSNDVSLGLLDMGGASLEAAYETPYDILDGWIQVDLFGSDYRLYGRSYLKLGVKEAFRKMILMEEINSMDVNPCIPDGYTLDYIDIDSGFEKILTGSSHSKCRPLVRKLLNLESPCYFPMDPAGETECHAYGNYAPPIYKNMTFYGVDGFSDLCVELHLYNKHQYNSLPGVHKKSHCPISMRQIEALREELCSNDWLTLKKAFPETDDDFLAQACFYATFIHEVLWKGLGFPQDFENLVFATKVRGKPLGWAVGLMIYQVDKMPVDVTVDPDIIDKITQYIPPHGREIKHVAVEAEDNDLQLIKANPQARSHDVMFSYAPTARLGRTGTMVFVSLFLTVAACLTLAVRNKLNEDPHLDELSDYDDPYAVIS